jgi:hypothetical protein
MSFDGLEFLLEMCFDSLKSLKKNESNKLSFYSVWFTDIRIEFMK